MKSKPFFPIMPSSLAHGTSQLELEHALLTGELTDTQACQKSDFAILEEIQEEERRLSQQAELDREQEQLQLEVSRGRIEQWEQLTQELREVLEEAGSLSRRPELEERYRRELEGLDGERRAFEDLEFRQLERQARREEEREALVARADRVRQNLRDRQLRIRELLEQQKTVQMQIEQEQSSSEIEKKLVQTQLQQEQRRLELLDQQLRNATRTPQHISLDSSDESSSSDTEMGSTLKIGSQSPWNQNLLLQVPDSTVNRLSGNESSFTGIESESSSIISSSDLPNESVSSSSDDRSRPTSEHVTQGIAQLVERTGAAATVMSAILMGYVTRLKRNKAIGTTVTASSGSSSSGGGSVRRQQTSWGAADFHISRWITRGRIKDCVPDDPRQCSMD
ncbi:hypothetical protein MRX96_024406 [Rhipicephalus microplus]